MVEPVGLTVGARVASTIISKLINEFIEYAKDQTKMQQGLKAELARVKKALPKIQAVVNAVDEGQIRDENPPLEEWLWQLRNAADEADDVMDEITYNYEKAKVEAEKNKVTKTIINFKTFFVRAVNKDPFLKRLKEAVKAIDGVAADVGEFHKLVKDLVKNNKKMITSAINNRETGSVLNVGTNVFGREKEKEDIIKKLLSGLSTDCKTEKKNLAILPIIGVGGVGKTTLVKDVYNDSTVKEHFKLRMWVCISNNFDVVLLTKKLYESVFKKGANLDNFDVIQNKLKEKLQFERFLVVFDDVWYDNQQKGWDDLIAPLTHGQSGSMMLLTTRMKLVPKLTGPNLMDFVILKGLNKYGMWDLFKECSFRGKDPNNYEELKKIGRHIVKKLKGSPLAAKTVGGILCSNLSEEYWRSILESELWSLEQGQNDIMSILKLTYQYLPGHLKSCFSFCSIFPQDHVFNKNDLINMWIALGMVPRSVNGIMMRRKYVGSKYFDDMLIRSIFIHDPKHPNNENFVMHDLIHELSVFVSQGEYLGTSTNKMVSVPNTIRHLYAHVDGPHDLIPDLSGLKNLRTFILHFDESHHDSNQDSLVNKILKGMESLRLLILLANLSKFPENASKLLHLRYLSISSSRISAFPKSVSDLYLLETMIYNGTSQLKQVDALGKLINLKELIIRSCEDTGMPPIWFRTQALLQLVRLTIEGCNFETLPCLEQLPLLKYMCILRTNTIKNIIHEFNQSFAVDAFPSLEVLSFRSMSAILKWSLANQPSKWMERLTKLNVCNCPKLQVMPPIPIGVKELRFENLGLNALPNLWNDKSSKSALVVMSISSCKNLISLSEGLLQNPKRFVALKELTIVSCDKLVNLPPGGFRNFISLKELHILFCSRIRVEENCILPSTLQKLRILRAGQFDTIFPKALESIHFLIELHLIGCENFTHLPPKEVFSKWKTIKILILDDCKALASLESLLGLPSIELLRVTGCPKLLLGLSSRFDGYWHSLPILDELPIRNQLSIRSLFSDRKMSFLFSKMKKEGTSQTTDRNNVFNHNHQVQPQSLSRRRTMETGQTSARETTLLSVDVLEIDDPSLLSIEPIRSLSSVRKLTVFDCRKLQSLPKLPPFLQELYIRQCCSPELLKRCEETGPEWPKLSQIPKVIIRVDNGPASWQQFGKSEDSLELVNHQ